MCLTAQALALFLNMLDPGAITTTQGRITIHADTRDAVWVQRQDQWCTMAPQIDRMTRFDKI